MAARRAWKSGTPRSFGATISPSRTTSPAGRACPAAHSVAILGPIEAARSEDPYLVAALVQLRAVAVELDLVLPLRTLGQSWT